MESAAAVMLAGAVGGGSGGSGGSASRRIPPKLYRISEIVEYSGVSRQTVHNYTTMGLITEARRTPGGHRMYDEGVFVRLDAIGQLKRERKNLRAIRQFLAQMDKNQ